MKTRAAQVRVRYQETDKMGVVYYANYLVWFEISRSEYFRKLGMPYSEFEKNGIYLPVVEAYCQYKAPARYDELIDLYARVTSLQEVRISFNYEIKRHPEAGLLASGFTGHAFVNREGRPVVLKKHNPFLWRMLMENLEADAD